MIVALFILVAITTLNINHQFVQSGTSLLPAASTATLVGGSEAGCGFLVGVAAVTAGAIIGGATMGFGAALALSVGLHVGAIACAS